MSATVIDLAPSGATLEEWECFVGLGLTEDLLPVVSNRRARISPGSTMSALGKVPSKYNAEGNAVGIPRWTSHQTSPAALAEWVKQSDYGVCLQTRRVRAIDIDVDHPQGAEIAAMFALAVRGWVDPEALPIRVRDNSMKCLLAFEMPGDFTKRVMRTAHGAVEFLASGQQFIAAGTHPSGARYKWSGGLPASIPRVSAETFERAWEILAKRFAIETPTQSRASSRGERVLAATDNDPTAKKLEESGRLISRQGDGSLYIECPFVGEHTTKSGPSATVYWPAHTGGYVRGHFKCLHAHCEHRSDDDFRLAVGMDPFDSMEEPPADTPPQEGERTRFAVQPAHEFAAGGSLEWIVKGVLPRAELGVVFGESGSGKTFAVLDLVAAIARGVEWRGHRVKQGRVVYVCSEGAGGFRTRLRAYAHENDLDLADLDVGVVSDAPNLLMQVEASALTEEIRKGGPASVIVIDTLAQAIPGGNENSGEDIGRALKHCRRMREVTGAMVLFVHHSGKDTTKGARGWSGLRAAADVEMEVIRDEEARALCLTKLKDGPEGGEYAFLLKRIQIGIDEDGDAVTSCAIEWSGTVPTRQKGRPRRAGKVEQIILGTIESAFDTERENIISAAIDAYPRGDSARDTRPQRIRRGVEMLLEKGAIKVDSDGNLTLSEGVSG